MTLNLLTSRWDKRLAAVCELSSLLHVAGLESSLLYGCFKYAPSRSCRATYPDAFDA